MSNKREHLAALLPNGLPFLESVDNNAKFAAMRRERFSDCPEFENRSGLYQHLASLISEPIDYLEFGLWQGASIREWASLNTSPSSRFLGFDSFHGLPEDWLDHPKGTFSTNGQPPRVDDSILPIDPAPVS